MSSKPTGVHYGNSPGQTGPAHYWGPKSNGAPPPSGHPLTDTAKQAADALESGSTFTPPAPKD